MNVETTVIDNKKYIEIDKINIKESNYVFLVNVQDEEDFCIRKLTVKDGEIYYEGLKDDKEFENVLAYFVKKHENILKEEN